MHKFWPTLRRPRPLKLQSRRWQRFLSVSLSIWWACATAAAVPVAAKTPPARGFVMNGSQPDSFSGISISNAGDVNGDGLTDIIVGTYFSSANGQYGAGRSYVVLGKRNIQPVELSAIESGSSPEGFVINGPNAYYSSGSPVSGGGDINGDGLADLIVGDPPASPNGQIGAGQNYVVFGKRNTQPVDLSTLEGTSQVAAENKPPATGKAIGAVQTLRQRLQRFFPEFQHSRMLQKLFSR
jgi:hypothetical protein